MIIDLIRHTTPDIADGICYGQTDLDLVSSFQTEFDLVHNKTMPHYNCVISSPLKRCYKLAKTLETNSLTQDPRLMEYNFGDWELKPWAEFKTEQIDNWMNNFVDQPAPNGDSILSMQQRVLEFWNELLKKDQQSLQKVAIVTHSGVQRLIHAHILSTPLEHLFRLELDYGSVIRVNYRNDTQLTTIKHL